MGACTNTLRIRNKKTGAYEIVPCGKCLECRKTRTSHWSSRLIHEERVSSSALFLTLTYDTRNCPITSRGFMSVSKRDLQLFFKRLRRAHERDHNGAHNTLSLKYFSVGEYGGRSYRPHYHVILFNAKLELIQDAWQKGQVHYGKVSGASVGYTLKYISKPGRIPLHKNDDRLPEFALMSKGLGKSFLSDQMVAWFKADPANRSVIIGPGGEKRSMPRYYKNKVFTETELALVSEAGKKRAQEFIDELAKKDSNWQRNMTERHLISNKIMERNYLQNSKF